MSLIARGACIACCALVLSLLAGTAAANCIDINAASAERLTEIRHINQERVSEIIDGRPWPGVRSLTEVHGIGRSRIEDILDQNLACAGVAAPRGARESIEGIATVLDADTLEVADEAVRLIGLDAPESEQLCHANDHDWPCGQIATAAVYELVGAAPVRCEVYGRDRWERALAVCHQGLVTLNAEIVRRGWALAWYPERGAILGPSYTGEQTEAEAVSSGLWRGTFVEPWIWRRNH